LFWLFCGPRQRANSPWFYWLAGLAHGPIVSDTPPGHSHSAQRPAPCFENFLLQRWNLGQRWWRKAARKIKIPHPGILTVRDTGY
jgi:hypothetical protein